MAMKLLEIPEQMPPEDIDEEILEIFVEEVEEVLEEIATHFKSWKVNPDDMNALKELRRAFHTLKGSGRLVGAMVIGELGWRFENMLNQIIEKTVPCNDNTRLLVGQVESVLPSMIEQFKTGDSVSHEVLLLISQVDYLTQTKGEDLGDFDINAQPTDEDVAAELPPSVEETLSAPAMEVINAEPTIESEIAEEVLPEIEATTEQNIDFSDELSTDALPDLEEGDEFSLEGFDDTLLSDDFTLDGLPDVDESFLTEDSIDFAMPSFEEAVTTTFAESEEEALDPMLLDIFKGEAQIHLASLKDYLTNYQADIPLSQDIVRIFHTLNGSSRSVNFTAVAKLAGPMETYVRVLADKEMAPDATVLEIITEATSLIEFILNGNVLEIEQLQTFLQKLKASSTETTQEIPSSATNKQATEAKTVAPQNTEATELLPDATDEFMSIFLDEAEEILENTQSLLERWQASPNNMQLMKELQRELHTLKGGARMVGIVPMGDLSHHLESVLTRIVEGTVQSNTRIQEIVQNSVDELAAMLEAVRSGVPLEMPNDLIKQVNIVLNPDKENETPEPLVKGIKEKQSVSSDEAKKAELEAASKPERAEKEDDVPGEDRIRVRVSLIDKLTNLAGELSISRAHMEQQQAAFKLNLSEMEQTVIRLRDQLRRLEIETEAQIISHFGLTGGNGSDEEEFDPLELDRFSVMQQLSRSLMETVTDLLSIQDFLKVLTRQSDTLLIQQTRIGAELQDGIMRTRMIPFSRITPRLQRIARLTARELRKQVEFIINGEEIEFERTVLNRIVAPLEHMLRNAIGHGIEDVETRKQVGKNAVAKITIDLEKEGSDLIIKLRDDGAGLNLAAIRKKAEDRGLIKSGSVISDQELMQFILEPSFSTAQKVTQISGRGVGMDVVNSEIKQLSGALQIFSKTGRGTTFEIRLPLSLTITQALLAHVGEDTYAIPLNHVDAVMRIPRQDVHGNHPEEERYYQYMDKNYRVFHLGDLLGVGRVASIDSSLIPTLLVRAGDRRVALLVDGIEGSKEIVVKSVGPQISGIRWVAGATVLGDGRVVIILDIPTVTRVDTTPQQMDMSVEEAEKAPITTIMVVDDSITVRKVTARLLKRQGMDVLTAKDGVDAVAQLQEHVPDLMLLDVEMPRMDGYELATQVRNTDNLKHIPIIMITSRTGAKHRDRAEKIGINRYLGKPFNETELLENINALLSESKETH